MLMVCRSEWPALPAGMGGLGGDTLPWSDSGLDARLHTSSSSESAPLADLKLAELAR